VDRVECDNRFLGKAKMKILCLGSSGFVGSVLLNHLRNHSDWEVKGINSLSLDLLNPGSIEKLANQLDEDTILIYSVRATDSKSPWEKLKVDLEMVHNVTDALAQKRVRRCIFFSTFAVYDDSITQLNITEKTNVCPQSLYGVAKFAGECLLAQVAAKKKFPLVILRPCKIYGPGDQNFEYGPGSFLYSALMGKPVRLYGDGLELRDHLFIEDLVQIVRHFVHNDESGVYNLASGISLTYQDTLSIVRRVINKEFEIIHEARTRLQVDQTVDISHLKQAVPELNLTSLEQGICKTFRDMEQRLSREALY